MVLSALHTVVITEGGICEDTEGNKGLYVFGIIIF